LCMAFPLIAFSLIKLIAAEPKSSSALPPAVQDHVSQEARAAYKAEHCPG
jgi:hypothetical protein